MLHIYPHDWYDWPRPINNFNGDWPIDNSKGGLSAREIAEYRERELQDRELQDREEIIRLSTELSDDWKEILFILLKQDIQLLLSNDDKIIEKYILDLFLKINEWNKKDDEYFSKDVQNLKRVVEILYFWITEHSKDYILNTLSKEKILKLKKKEISEILRLQKRERRKKSREKTVSIIKNWMRTTVNGISKNFRK